MQFHHAIHTILSGTVNLSIMDVWQFGFAMQYTEEGC